MNENDSNYNVNINENYENKNYQNENEEEIKIFYYENVFNIISNIVNTYNENEKQILIIKILIKILKNILESTLNNFKMSFINNLNNNFEQSEKFRKLKLSNTNIQLIFTVEGIYDFFKLLGFVEKYFEHELYLYIPIENVDINVFTIIVPFLSLLLLNFD
jgi:hypothetical protein